MIDINLIIRTKVYEANGNDSDAENQCPLPMLVPNRTVRFIRHQSQIDNGSIELNKISQKLDALFNQIDAVRSLVEVLDRRLTNAEETLNRTNK